MVERTPEKFKSIEDLEEAFGRGEIKLDEFQYAKMALKTQELKEKLSRGEISREEFLRNQLRAGLEKLVVHGDYLFQEDGSVELRLRPDLDAMAGLYIMDQAKINYAVVEFQHKGSWVPGAMHIDTGGRKEFTIEDDGSVFFDHHGAKIGEYTSAAQITYEKLVELGFLKKEEWLDRFTTFITEIDNLSYPLDEKFFRGSWSNTLYGVQKILPVSVIAEFFKKGKDPREPFTMEEATQTAVRVRGKNGEWEDKTLLDVCNNTSQKVKMSMANIGGAVEKMKKLGVSLETPDLGKVALQIVEKGKKNKIPMGFTAAKSLGYDTYVLWNEAQKSFFMSSQTKDIPAVYEKIKDKIPTAKLIRGTMLLSPPTADVDLTRDKFLEFLGLKEYTGGKPFGDKEVHMNEKETQPSKKEGLSTYIETLRERFGEGSLDLEKFSEKMGALRRIANEENQQDALDEAFGEGTFTLEEYQEIKTLLGKKYERDSAKEELKERAEKIIELIGSLSREDPKLLKKALEDGLPQILKELSQGKEMSAKELSQKITDILLVQAEKLPGIKTLKEEKPAEFENLRKELNAAVEKGNAKKFEEALTKRNIAGETLEESKKLFSSLNALRKSLQGRELNAKEKESARQEMEALSGSAGKTWEKIWQVAGLLGIMLVMTIVFIIVLELAALEMMTKKGKK